MATLATCSRTQLCSRPNRDVCHSNTGPDKYEFRACLPHGSVLPKTKASISALSTSANIIRASGALLSVTPDLIRFMAHSMTADLRFLKARNAPNLVLNFRIPYISPPT